MPSSSTVSLFTGIGGFEHGLIPHGFQPVLLCENDPAASAVLAARMPDADMHPDITRLRALPAGTELVTAGFPCQDLSPAGRTAGISGTRSSLVQHVFRLAARPRGPRWLLIENVPFMLQLGRGAAMRHITTSLEELGYTWAYRVVDARAFGLPQRRQRVLLLASRTEDPRTVLFTSDVGDPGPVGTAGTDPCGFYWTEGLRGLGWVVNGVPTLKGGSSVGIPSPPAVLLPTGAIVTPSITDAERLQGFPPGWTEPALTAAGTRAGHRWRLVGNAVSTRMAEWVGGQLRTPQTPIAEHTPLRPDSRWPAAAWGRRGQRFAVPVSAWPVHRPYQPLRDYLTDTRPLSVRATRGFLDRAERSSLRFPPGFLAQVHSHLNYAGGSQCALGT